MARFPDMLAYLRKKTGLSQQELADKLGLKRSAIGMYETGKREPDLETFEAFADFFNVDMDYLHGKTTIPNRAKFENILPPGCLPMPKFVKKPRLGTIACGEPILAVEEATEFDEVPDDVSCDFTLLCKGDSMINARIFDGDVVFIRQQDMVDNGEIAAVLIENEATLKRVRLFDDHISLEPENPLYKPLVYWGEEMNSIRILGKAVAFKSLVR